MSSTPFRDFKGKGREVVNLADDADEALRRGDQAHAGGHRAEFVRVMEEHDTVTDFQSQIFRKDNSIIWITENVRAVRDSGGNLLYYEGTVEDITARKLADERIRDSENLYHSLVENLPQNIFRKNLDERFTFANQRFCQTVGLPLEKILGRTDFDLFPAELATKYQADDRRVRVSWKTHHRHASVPIRDFGERARSGALQMEELTGGASRETKQEWWSMCQYKVRYSGWNPGRAAHTYKDKFGVWPRGLDDHQVKGPSLEFEKFVKAKLIRYLKGKVK